MIGSIGKHFAGVLYWNFKGLSATALAWMDHDGSSFFGWLVGGEDSPETIGSKIHKDIEKVQLSSSSIGKE